MHVLEPVNTIVLAGQRPRVFELLPQRLVEMSLMSVLLPEPDAPVTATSIRAERSRRSFQVVLARTPDDERLAVAFAPLPRQRNRPLAGKELAGGRRFAENMFWTLPCTTTLPP